MGPRDVKRLPQTVFCLSLQEEFAMNKPGSPLHKAIVQCVGCALLSSSFLAVAEEPSLAVALPTVSVQIHKLGPTRVKELSNLPGVNWSLELGSEMLLGVDASALPTLRELPEYLAEPGWIARDDLMIAGHTCTDLTPQIWAVVGGYDLVHVPASLQSYQQSVHPVLTGLSSENRAWSARHLSYAQAQSNQTAGTLARRADPLIDALVARVDPDRWFQSMSELAAFNRNSYSTGLFTARDYVAERFTRAELSASNFEFSLANITSCVPTPPAITLPNVIGTKVGLATPNEWLVIGAHYDSRNPSRCDGNNNPQPGANDNASGCAGVMEMARVFQGIRTDRSMLFMCFSGEEQGLVGSRRYVEALQANGDISKVKLMLNMDMIGYDVNNLQNARIESNAANQALINQLLAAGNLYSPQLNFITSTNANAGSDHFYFLQAGVPTAVTWENGASAYPQYHQIGDVPAAMTGARVIAGGILRMNAAVLADYAKIVRTDEFANGFE